ncbi:MAG: hypothetical protein OEQ24_10200 [Gammaproteobacteria bacterium]|nr:hypothetical protein [Gammaproteobacteria bacterium]
MLDNIDTDIIQKQGWMLDRMFNDDVANSHETYQKAVDYAKILSAQFNVALRSVTHNNSHFLEVYRK